MKPDSFAWRLDRRINLSVLVQLMVLASLIVGSWLNLQRQLDLLQAHNDFTEKLEVLSARTLAHEYRVQAVEKRLGEQP